MNMLALSLYRMVRGRSEITLANGPLYGLVRACVLQRATRAYVYGSAPKGPGLKFKLQLHEYSYFEEE